MFILLFLLILDFPHLLPYVTKFPIYMFSILLTPDLSILFLYKSFIGDFDQTECWQFFPSSSIYLISHSPHSPFTSYHSHMFLHLTHLFVHLTHLFVHLTHLFLYFTHLFVHLTHRFTHLTHLFVHLTHLSVHLTHRFTHLTHQFVHLTQLLAHLTHLFTHLTHLFTHLTHLFTHLTHLFTHLSHLFPRISPLYSHQMPASIPEELGSPLITAQVDGRRAPNCRTASILERPKPPTPGGSIAGICVSVLLLLSLPALVAALQEFASPCCCS